MKKKHIIALILTLVLIIALAVLGLSYLPTFDDQEKVNFRYKSFRYRVENDEATITQYVGYGSDVVIPESIKGMPVVAIADDAFANSITIKSVTIPDSVTRIGYFAFMDCSSLERVTLGNGIREIDFSAFSGCKRSICTKYENGYYLGNDENPYLALVCTESQDIETLTIHPDAVVICGSAMDRCYALKEISFPEGVVSIGGFAMEYCGSLEKVYIPKTVEFIDTFVFEGCNSIREITVSDENTHYKSVGGVLFSRDGSRLIKYTPARTLDRYSVPDGTVIIENNAFDSALYLTEVTLPDSVETLEHSAFLDCKNLQSIHLGEGLKEIGGCAFSSCVSLTEITIPDSVEELSYSIFSGCDKLESVVLGSGITHMDFEIFSGCDSLNEVVFRDPEGWGVNAMYSFKTIKLDLSDPKRNAEYLTGEYREYYWSKK